MSLRRETRDTASIVPSHVSKRTRHGAPSVVAMVRLCVIVSRPWWREKYPRMSQQQIRSAVRDDAAGRTHSYRKARDTGARSDVVAGTLARRLSLAQDEVLGSAPRMLIMVPAGSYGVKVRLHQKALPHNASPLRPTSTYKRRSKALCRVGRGRGDPNLR